MRLALPVIAILLTTCLNAQQTYWLFSGRDYSTPTNTLSIGLTLRSFRSKDPVPKLINQQADISFAKRIIERQVVMPAPPLQLGIRMLGWHNSRLAGGFEVFMDLNREQIYYSEEQDLEVVFPAKNELQEVGMRVHLQSLVKLGSVHIKPLLSGGVMLRSEGYNFYMRQDLAGTDTSWQFISTDYSADYLLDFNLFNLFFVGAGAEVLLLALPSKNHTHIVNFEFMAQRYLHRQMTYSIDYENSVHESAWGRTTTGSGWWAFSVGLNYSFF